MSRRLQYETQRGKLSAIIENEQYTKFVDERLQQALKPVTKTLAKNNVSLLLGMEISTSRSHMKTKQPHQLHHKEANYG